MAIPAEVVEEFDAKIRERGHEYFISGDVKITETLDGLILRAYMAHSFTTSRSISATDGSIMNAIAPTPRPGAVPASMSGRSC